MNRLVATTWLTALWFLLLSNVHAWDVPHYVRIDGGARMWFTVLDGDLIQPDKTKLDLIDNLGLNRNQLSWEFFSSFRFNNIHVFRVRLQPSTDYDGSQSLSHQSVQDIRTGYDLDFCMTPQLLFGANADLVVLNADSRVRNVTVGNMPFNYQTDDTRFYPAVGLHGTFYPILEGIALRPNVSGRVNWWNYRDLETWDWEVGAAVDVPINRLWTWSVQGGYRCWHMKFQRSVDWLDINRSGFFVETSILF
ncbi:MAG: hypothetical protein V1792_16650 [Pseudomonadota bacterium]